MAVYVSMIVCAASLRLGGYVRVRRYGSEVCVDAYAYLFVCVYWFGCFRDVKAKVAKGVGILGRTT